MSRRPFRPIAPEVDHDALAAALPEDYAPPKPKEGLSAAEERWLSGYEEIAEWVGVHGRAPEDRQGADTFERLLAVRLSQLRGDEAACEFLRDIDERGLLSESPNLAAMQPWDAAAEAAANPAPNSIRVLRHVSAPDLRREPEHIAQREPCADFALYEVLFKQVEQDLATGAKLAKSLASDLSVSQGDLFILGGQLAYVAHVGEEFLEPDGRPNARLLVVYSNGTQSNLLRRSLQKPLSIDPASRRVQAAHHDPLFEYAKAQSAAAGEREDEGRRASEDEVENEAPHLQQPPLAPNGTLYVLRSLSMHPFVAEHREFLHKIGVTGGDVRRRVAKAEQSSTFLFAPVEVVASYTLPKLGCYKLETLLHQFFAAARVAIEINDRFGKSVRVKEWFHVPLSVIDDVVARIKDRTITDYVYDAPAAQLLRAK